MFRQSNDFKWLFEVVARFQKKGAVSPDKAMTPEELGLPPTFEVAMKRRLGRLGIFIEVDGKYYLSEQRLKQLEELRSKRWVSKGPRKKLMTLRILQLVIGILVVILILFNFFVESYEARLISFFLIIVWLFVSIIRLYYAIRLGRSRKIPDS